MSRHNVQQKQPDSAEQRAEPRPVSPDEFKHELLKFARRDGKPLSIIDVGIANAAAIAASGAEGSLDKLSRSLYSAVAKCGEAAHVHTAINVQRLLILVLDRPDEIVEKLRKQLSRLSLPNLVLRPVVQIEVQPVLNHDVDAALHQLGIEIDEHGTLCEIKSQMTGSLLGSKSQWSARYKHECGQLRDMWRNAQCVQHTIKGTAASRVSLKRLKALQMSDHPSIQPLLDFWLDKETCELVADLAHGTQLEEWSAKHKPDLDTARELALQYVSMLIYGRSQTPALDLHGLQKHLFVSSAEPRLQLAASAHATIVQSGSASAPESDAVRDAREFAERFGLQVADCATLTKLRTALKNAQFR